MFFITSVIVRELATSGFLFPEFCEQTNASLDDIPDQLYRVKDNQKALEEKSGWNFVVMRMAYDDCAIVGAWYQENGQTRFIGHGSGEYYKDWYTY